MFDVNAYDSLHIVCLRVDFIYLHIDRIFYVRLHTIWSSIIRKFYQVSLIL